MSPTTGPDGFMNISLLDEESKMDIVDESMFNTNQGQNANLNVTTPAVPMNSNMTQGPSIISSLIKAAVIGQESNLFPSQITQDLKFDGKDFDDFKKRMENVFNSSGLWPFITGVITTAQLPDENLRIKFNQKLSMAYYCLENFITTEIRRQVPRHYRDIMSL
jgi:hypothetical protein